MANSIVVVGSLFSFLRVFFTKNSYVGMVCFVLVNLLCVQLYANKAALFFGFESNYANIFYAAALFGMAVIIENFGAEKAYDAVKRVFISFMVFMILSWFSVHSTVVSGNEHVSEVIAEAYQLEMRIVAASFFAFYFVNSVLVYFYNKYHTICKASAYIICVCTAQVFDSLIFFTIAFGNIFVIPKLLEYMLTGLVVKCVLTILATPLFILMTRKNDHVVVQ